MRLKIPLWLSSFLPAPSSTQWPERVRACLCAFLGLMITVMISREMIGHGTISPVLVGPMGATALVVFCVPASPMAQPWPVLCGNIISALIGVACIRVFRAPLWLTQVAPHYPLSILSDVWSASSPNLI